MKGRPSIQPTQTSAGIIISAHCIQNVHSDLMPYRIQGVDLKAAERLVRRLLLRRSLVPTYTQTPPLSSQFHPALETLLQDPERSFGDTLHPAVDPGWRAHEVVDRSGVPLRRAVRKRLQVVAVLRALLPILTGLYEQDATLSICDFCGGCGHIGIIVAALFPNVRVTVVDRAKKALQIAEARAYAANLSNFKVLHCNVGDLPLDMGHFDIALALHACGPASDAVLSQAAKQSAAIVVVPCCVGAVCNAASETLSLARVDGNNCPELAHPAKSTTFANFLDPKEFEMLARAADFSEESTLKRDQWRGVAKALLEHDRLLALREAGYDHIHLVKMRPTDCSPKNDILIAWHNTERRYRRADSIVCDLSMAVWPVDHLSNGVFKDLMDANVLTGLGGDEVDAVEETLRNSVCAPGSLGFYESASGGGPRSRKVIHAVAHSLALSHESVGKGIERRVIVKRNEFWPLFFDCYVGIGGPYVDAIAKELLALGVVPKDHVNRRRFIRGNAHHITIVTPKEVSAMPMQLKANRDLCLESFHRELFGTSFEIIGIGVVERSGTAGHDDLSNTSSVTTAGKEIAYFAVLDWPAVQLYRRKLGLSTTGLHITLGFRDKDVHGIRKDLSTIFHPVQMLCSPWLKS